MADGKELKPKSFRIDDETAEKFKEISNSIGGNQQETLTKLIEAYEFQSGKAILTEKKTEIEQFEKYITVLTRMYMSSLEDNQNATQIIRAEFDAQLRSKDAIIQDLQEKLTVAKQLKEDATGKAKSYADENIRLNKDIDNLKEEYNTKMSNLQSMLSDKDNLNKALTDSCNELKSKVNEMTEAVEQSTQLQQDLNELTSKYQDMLKEQATLNEQLEQSHNAYDKMVAELQKHEADSLEDQKALFQIELEKKILELQIDYQNQLEILKTDKQDEINKYQQKYFDLLEQLEMLKSKKQNEIDKYQQKYLDLLERFNLPSSEQ